MKTNETTEPAPPTILDALAPVLTHPQRERLQQSQQTRRYLPGQYLFRQGDPADIAFCVITGQVAIHQIDPDNERRTLYVAQPGDIISLHEAIRTATHVNGAIALCDVECCSISSEILRQIMAENPAMLIEVMRVVCQQIGTVEQRMQRAAAGR